MFSRSKFDEISAPPQPKKTLVRTALKPEGLPFLFFITAQHW
jgi:hypothetical protein